MKYDREEIREKYKDLFEHSLDLIYVSDINGQILDANDIALTTLGYKREEIPNVSFINLMDKEQLKQAYIITKKIMETRSLSKLVEFRVKAKDGNLIYVETYAIPLIKNGKSYAILGIAKNITDLKNTQERLKKSNRKYRYLYKTTPFSIVLLNSDGVIVDCNPRMQKMLGYKKIELIGRYYKNISVIHQKFLPEVLKLFQKITKGEIVHRIDIQMYRRDGSLIWVNLRGSIVIIHGKIFVQAIFYDITERKMITQKLKESVSLYKTLVKTSPNAVVVTDLKGKIIEVSQKAIELYEVNSSEDLIGKNSFDFIVPEDIPKAMENLQKALRENITIKEEYTLIKQDGTHYIGEINASLMKDINGKPKAFIGILRDITEQKYAEKLLKESEEQYRHLYENALVGLWTIRIQDGVFIRANEISAKIVGYENVDNFLNNCTSIDLFDKDSRRKFFRILKEEGEISGYEQNFIDKRGNEKYISMSAKIYRKKGYIEGSFTDITDFKRVQKELQESEENYRFISENANDLIAVFNEKLIFEFINEKAHMILLGYSKADMIGKVLFNFIHPEDLNKVAEMIREYMGGKTEIRFKRKDGTYIWLEVRGKTFKDDSGSFKGLTISRDVTERREAVQKLKESEEKFRTITEQSLMGIIILQDGIFKYVNEAIFKIGGYSAQEFMGWSINEFAKLIHPNDLPFVMDQAKKKQAGETDIVTRYTLRIFTKSREVKWIDLFSKTISFQGRPADFITIVDITARKETEQKLKESEEKYRIISENANDMISVINEEFRYEYINEEVYKKIVGYSNEDLIGKSPLDNVHSEDIKKAVKIWRTAVISGEGTIELRHKKKDGTWIWLEIRGKKFIDTNGEQKGIIISRDITKRKIAEQKLKDSEKKYRHLFESSPYSIGLLDLDGNLIDCNTATNQFLSTRTKEDLIGKNFREIFSIKEKEKPIISIIEKNIISLLNSEILEPFEFPLIRSNGSIQWINFHISLIKIGDETLLQFIMQDITEKKKAEQNLKKSEEKYRRLHENSPNAIILTNTKGIIIDCNTATEKIFGYNKKEMIGQNYTDAGIITSSHMSIFKKRYEEFLKGKTLKPIELQINKKDGTPRWINYQSSLIKLDEEILIQAILQDITEKKKAELIIKEEFKKLKELEQIRKDLVSRVSHELKTPLIPVISGSELLITTYEDQIGKDAFEILQMINKGGIRLKKLIEKLINVSRIEYNKLELEKDVYNLSELIMECSKDMKYLIEKRKIILNLDIPESLFLEIDKLKIEEVITNLLSNAIKNTPPNGKISINLQRQDNSAILNVNDTGVGLTEKEMNVLFTRFGKIERYNYGLEYIDIKGSGLGLYISKEIIALHGGEIGAKSPGRNKGSTFTVKLPIK